MFVLLPAWRINFFNSNLGPILPRFIQRF